ncbi:hypothetical protein ASD50_07720 [Mesorhizobium sp. Root552]|uniref:hypothetical protein n=1 Tax=Mesorhizobium sp. Root552 TaxID=1736555 RepID=UPI0006FD945C|nr:hypothetical protein [Mesorhizobium sp. Root552]KQZ19362.1 hypothetical protein ASD50_07720 [Mesorhizobium sp. Root552]
MAKKTIVQRIALDGGREIEKQLKDMGEAGEKAFDQIRKAALKADLTKFGASLKTFSSDLATVGRRLALAFTGAAAAATAVGAGALKLAKDSAEVVDGMGKAAEAAGLTVDAYGRLEFAAKMANVEQTEFQAGMARLNKALGDAARGSKSAIDLFSRLGVNIKGTDGKIRPTEAILQDIAEAFSKMPDGAAKSAIAIELFGRSGAKLLPLLNSGKQGLIDLGKEAEKLGIVFDKNAADIADEMGDALDEVSFAAKGIRLWLGLIFAPAVTEGARLLRDVIVQNRDAILQFGKALTLGTVRLIGDLVNALAGNDERVRNPWILKWRDAVIEFGRNLAAVVNGVVLPLFRMISEGARLVADGLNAVFGTKLTGGQLLIAAALLKLLGVFKLFASAIPVIINGVKLLGSAFAFLAGRGAMGAIATLFRGLVTGALSFLGLVAGLVGWPALIVAGVVAAGVAIYAFWDDITAAASSAWEYLKNLFSGDGIAAIAESLRNAGAAAGQMFVEALQLALQGIGAVFIGIGQLIAGFVDGAVSAISGLAAQLLPTWDQIKAGASAIWDEITARATTAFDFIVQSASGLGSLLSPVWTAIANTGSAVWTTISGAAAATFNGLASVISTTIGGVTDTISTVIGAIVDGFTGATSAVVDAANEIAAAISRATEAAGDIEVASQLADALVTPFRQASTAIDGIMGGIRSMVESGFSALTNLVNQVASQIQSAIDRILSALRAAAAEAARLRSAAGSSGGSSSTTQGFASGGHVRGAGGPTSDSILAWLSNGEFVMRAAVVKRLGVDFFHAINNGILPSLKGLKGFSVGGLVDGIGRSLSVDIPRFAGGGFANMQLAPAASSGGFSGTPVTIVMPDGERFDTVAPVQVAAKLSTYATGSATLSAGRKPGWYK